MTITETMTLEPSEARLMTATVSVQVLTINGRQVTLAVYRQIRQAPLGSGPIWGRINYCIPTECTGRRAPHWKGSHIHVVWQDGNDLKRSVVEHPNYERATDETYEEARGHYERAMAAWAEIGSVPQLFIAV